MKLLLNSYCKSLIAPGNYNFIIISANVITSNNQLQVAFRLGKEEDDSYRVYLLQAYPIDLSAESEFIMLMKGAFCSLYPDFIKADTDSLDMFYKTWIFSKAYQELLDTRRWYALGQNK